MFPEKVLLKVSVYLSFFQATLNLPQTWDSPSRRYTCTILKSISLDFRKFIVPLMDKVKGSFVIPFQVIRAYLKGSRGIFANVFSLENDSV